MKHFLCNAMGAILVGCSNPVAPINDSADWIAFGVSFPDGTGELALADFNDPSNYEFIVRDGHSKHLGAFSPDKSLLIYGDLTTGYDHDDQLVLYDIRKRKPTPLFYPPGRPLVGGRVVWKPDGTGIYYQVVDFFLYNIFYYDFTSAIRKSITQGNVSQEWPVGFKGADTLIVFSDDSLTTGQPWGFYFMDLDGKYLSRIDNPHLEHTNPNASTPWATYSHDWNDEKGLFTYSMSDSSYEGFRIAITDLTGAIYRSYTEGYRDFSPVWGPEGETLIFTRIPISVYAGLENSKLMILTLESGEIREFVPVPGARYFNPVY